MAADLDPLSQLIGGLTAQVSAQNAQMIDLRSEIMTNRAAAQVRWDALAKEIEAVHAEYRNVKHLEQELAQKDIAIDSRLKKVEGRLEAIENTIVIWRVKLSVLMVVGISVGTVVVWALHSVVNRLVEHFL